MGLGDWLGPVGDLIGGALGFESQRRTNSAQHDMSMEQMAFQERVGKESQATDMAFQERMSSTAQQRQVNDLAAAGLNPMLGYMKGSSSSTPSGTSFSPSGSQPQLRAPGVAAMEALSQASQAMANSASAAKAKAEANLATAEIPGAAARAHLDETTAQAWDFRLKKLFPEAFKQEGFRTETMELDREIREVDAYEAAQKRDAMRSGGPPGDNRGARAARAELEERVSGARERKAGARLEEARVPGAEVQERIDRSAYGQRFRGYLPDVSKFVGSAASALGAGSAVKYLMTKPYKGVMSRDIKSSPLVDKETGEIFNIRDYRRRYGK